MKSRHAGLGPTTLVLLSFCVLAAEAQQSEKPYLDARVRLVEYAGPGREIPAPNDLHEVLLGWFGPDDPTDLLGGPMWCAAEMAIEDANRDGGYQGLPFRIVPRWSDDPWGSGVKGVTHLAYQDEVWALVGAPDGASAHLVEQVVAKARLPFLNAVSTDKTANLVNVPWIFTCPPGDHRVAPVLARALVSEAEAFALLSCTDHDSRVFATEFLAALRQLEVHPATHQQFRPGASFGRIVDDLRHQDPAAIVLVAPPREAASFLIELRDAGLTQPVFGGPRLGRSAFRQLAGAAADGVRLPLLWTRSSIGRAAFDFARRFEERFGIEPDYTAAFAYDAVTLGIAAIRTAGLNRAHIRDALRDASPYDGVSGSIQWDATGHNDRPAEMAVVRERQIVPLN